MALNLHPVEGPELEPLIFEKGALDVILGRHEACDCFLDSKYVSRRHASIRYEEKKWLITDLDSRDGIFLDSIQLEPQEPTALHDGEMLTIGPWVFLISGAESKYKCSEDIDMSDTLPTNAELLLALNDEQSTRREQAWKSFVKRYEHVIRNVARRFGLADQDADDVVQDVLFGLIRIGEVAYDENKGMFRAYLKTATKNAVIAKWRKASKEVSGLEDFAVDTFNIQWERRWREHVLQLALRSVQLVADPIQYEAFELFGRRGVAAQQVAQRIGKSSEYVRQAKCRVMAMVRSEIVRLDDAQ
ncbi:MAG: sigma-70 family RNA polymerase sigma factor [Phycisphaerales bacterium]|nr:sigma-70 family RNA polymerase sigma factor [Planctomycetota bacterium]MBL6997252.1 sigma-70 family RNA polymerase sigma factor [Phycisphaerales bacterium]